MAMGETTMKCVLLVVAVSVSGAALAGPEKIKFPSD